LCDLRRETKREYTAIAMSSENIIYYLSSKYNLKQLYSKIKKKGDLLCEITDF